MLNLAKLSARTRTELLEAIGEDHTDAAQVAATLTWAEAFDVWCQYEGLINYGPRLRALAIELQGAQEISK